MGKILPGLIVSFVNQKGGCGKSTATLLFSNWLFSGGNESELRVAVVDCDNQQQTLADMRQRNMLTTEKTAEQMYTIIPMDSQMFAERLENLRQIYDIILVDLPGNMEQGGVTLIYHLIDVAFIPFKITEADITGTLKFWEKYKNIIQSREKEGFKTAYIGVTTAVKVNSTEFKEFETSMKPTLPFPVLDEFIRDSVDYTRISTTDQKYDWRLNSVFEKLVKIIVDYMN